MAVLYLHLRYSEGCYNELDLYIVCLFFLFAACSAYVGLESGAVLDKMMDASSSISDASLPGRGRLNQLKSKSCKKWQTHIE